MNDLCTAFSVKLVCSTVVDISEGRRASSLRNPHSVRPVLHVSSGFAAWRLAVTEPEVPVLCAAVRLGFDTGQSDQSYANGNQMGRESPVDYRRRREACVFMYSCGDLGPLSFLPFFLPSLSQTNGRSHVGCLHAPFINALCHLTEFDIPCQSTLRLKSKSI